MRHSFLVKNERFINLSEKVQIQINDAKFQANQNPEHDAGFYLFLLVVNLIPPICHFQGPNALLETFEKHVLAVDKCA